MTEGTMLTGRFVAVAAMAAAFGSAGAAAAQSPVPLGVEARVAAAFPRGALEDVVGTGVGFGVNAAVQLLPNYALYAGYSRTSFGIEDDDHNLIDSGFSVGLSRGFPVSPAVMPWVGVGLLVHDLSLDSGETLDADSQLGFEFGGGVALAVAPRVRVTPGIGYRQYSARLAGPERDTISYFTAGVGLNVAF